ncbi:MAG: C45 family peptidase [Thermoguttaceae bacterium]|nr:C45 family peptidase [Thermoguttaceae bacterium]MDW8036509.1 C45 family peptidase [Thermoguttaceae bacterium]
MPLLCLPWFRFRFYFWATLSIIVGSLSLHSRWLWAEDRFRYQEAQYDGAQLRYVGTIPVLMLSGSPEQMGRQQGKLGAPVAEGILSYPRELFETMGRKGGWAAHLEMAKKMRPQFPPDHLAELQALAQSANLPEELLLATNTLPDAYRARIGCSSLIVQANRSKTGGPLFGRNLDFYALGKLHQYSLVIVYRPTGKHAFASVGFPGLLGCISGINDAGLALAVHECPASADGSPLFNPEGVPYGLLFRRILEECTSVEEAIKLVQSAKRTTLLNLALCDPNTHAVVEMSPRTVAVRKEADGICVCTNHFRTEKLRFVTYCPRYERLLQAKKQERLGLEEVAALLHQAHQGPLTIQTMIFEPAELRLHLAIGNPPTSARPLEKLDLAPLLRPKKADSP